MNPQDSIPATASSSGAVNADMHQSSNPTACNAQADKIIGNGAQHRDVSNRMFQLMNVNNPHSLNDPTIQESLSPFYQPFGVDVSHLPMTNPPIFQQSCLPSDDPPIRRRRISISNGQISQLGEDIETVENLYNTQPPPMPYRMYENAHHGNHFVNEAQHENMSGTAPGIHAATLPNADALNTDLSIFNQIDMGSQMIPDHINQISKPELSNNPLPRNNSGNKGQHLVGVNLTSQVPRGNYVNTMANHGAQSYPVQVPIHPTQDQLESIRDQGIQNQILTQPQYGQRPSNQQHIQQQIQHQNQLYEKQQQQFHQQQLQTREQQNILSSKTSSQSPDIDTKFEKSIDDRSRSSFSEHNYNGEYHPSDENSMPGTNAWKRARLLERNRIAASRCRQRKKVAQMQLQKDLHQVSQENNNLKKKVDYYEKLVSKFKKFSEAHFAKCDSKDSESFRIIEEMLMIDSGISEVNNSGTVIKMEGEKKSLNEEFAED